MNFLYSETSSFLSFCSSVHLSSIFSHFPSFIYNPILIRHHTYYLPYSFGFYLFSLEDCAVLCLLKVYINLKPSISNLHSRYYYQNQPSSCVEMMTLTLKYPSHNALLFVFSTEPVPRQSFGPSAKEFKIHAVIFFSSTIHTH